MVSASHMVMIISILVFVFGIPLILKKYYPVRPRLGILLCLILITGQLYLPGGVVYFLGLVLLFSILSKLVNDGFSLIVVNLLSAGIMYWRFSQLNKEPAQEITK